MSRPGESIKLWLNSQIQCCEIENRKIDINLKQKEGEQEEEEEKEEEEEVKSKSVDRK